MQRHCFLLIKESLCSANLGVTVVHAGLKRPRGPSLKNILLLPRVREIRNRRGV